MIRPRIGNNTILPDWPRSLPTKTVLATAMLTSPVNGQELVIVPGIWSTGNPFLDWLVVLVGLAFFWCVFYWGLYPKLLPHFGELTSRSIFWSCFALYFVCWMHFCSFTIFSYGLVYGWILWSFLITVPLLALIFLLSFVRS